MVKLVLAVSTKVCGAFRADSNSVSHPGIDLKVIDITDSKRFNKDKDKKYLNFIINEIGIKMGEVA